MQTTLKIFVIVAIAVIIALGLYVLVETEFSMSMGMGGFSPGFSWLLKIRAAENGGQIAPSLDELGASGGLPPFMTGGAGVIPGADGGHPGAALSKGLNLGKAPAVFARDLGLLFAAAALAILFEVALVLVVRPRRQRSAQA